MNKLCPRCRKFGSFNKKSTSSDGLQYWCKACKAEDQLRRRRLGLAKDSRDRYRKFKKDTCEQCGFVATHKCQLDVDHIDSNHENNDFSNLRTLCANCHRLKTYINLKRKELRLSDRPAKQFRK